MKPARLFKRIAAATAAGALAACMIAGSAAANSNEITRAASFTTQGNSNEITFSPQGNSNEITRASVSTKGNSNEITSAPILSAQGNSNEIT